MHCTDVHPARPEVQRCVNSLSLFTVVVVVGAVGFCFIMRFCVGFLRKKVAEGKAQTTYFLDTEVLGFEVFKLFYLVYLVSVLRERAILILGDSHILDLL